MKQKFLTTLRLRLTMLVALLCSLGTGTAWADELTFDYADYKGNGTSGTGSEYSMENSNVTITESKFYCGSDLTYAQFYANGTTTITPGAGVTITEIVLTATGSKYNGYQSSGTVTPSTGTVTKTDDTTVTWTGSATSAFTISHNKQIRWTTIVVTYTVAPGTTASPSISGDTPFLGSTTVTLTNAASADGADIYYTLNGDVPTTTTSATCFHYTAPFVLTATTTVKAIAKHADDTNASSVVSKTFTKITPMSVAEARAAIDAGTGTSGVYVTGIVCTGGSSLSSGAMDYWISDDGTTTDRFEVYKGKGLNGANFESTDDVSVGDVVVVYGNIKKFGSSTYEFDSGSVLISHETKAASDLTVTSSDPVNLSITSGELTPQSTITWTTSSTGTVSFLSNNVAVAMVNSSTGVITAVGEGSTTITITQAADATYQAGQQTVTVNVADNRSVCVTSVDLSSPKTITKGESAALSATSTKTPGYLGEVTYSYESADPTIFSITDGNYTGAGVGATTVTVTATPAGGYATSYKSVSQVVDVTVNGTNSISIDPTSKEQAFGTGAFDIAATVPTENYNGTVTAESSNTAVATVSVDGTTVTVTPVAVGTANITVTAGTDTYYPATAAEICAVTVTAPEGSGTAKAAGNLVLFGESFGDNEGSARAWDDSYSVKSGVLAVYSGITGYTVSNVKQGKNTTGSTKSGLNQSSQGTDAYIIIGPLDVADYSNMTLSYQWKAASIKGTYTTSAYYKTSAEGDFTLLEGTGDGATKFVERSYAVPAAAQVSTLYLKIVWNTSNSQAIIDEVQLTIPSSSTEAVKLNSYGYATFCSVYPLDGTQTGDYSLWTVTDIDGTEITFTKVTGAFEGGQGVLVKGAAGATVEIPSVDSDVELAGNLLHGTTAPTFVEAGAVYGLSGSSFVPSNADGVIPAGKAYIDADDVPELSSVKAFTFVFEDPTTGITETRTVAREEVEGIFNLAGQRMSKMQKGINIVNGKKVLVK